MPKVIVIRCAFLHLHYPLIYGMLGGIMLWTMFYSRRMRKQGEEARAARLAHEVAEANMVVTDGTVA